MKTIRSAIVEKLIDHGLWPDEAEVVMDGLMKSPNYECMTARWGEPVNAYPVGLINVVWIDAKNQALAWLEKNKPEHFARAMFQ